MSARHWAAATIVMVVGVALALPAQAQKGSRAARGYVEAAAQADAFEMREAEAVLNGSTDPRVLAYAQMMLRDHAATRRALAAAAVRAGVEPPPIQLGGDQALLLGALQSLSGPDLDKAYATHQALAHRSALTVQQDYAANGDDAGLRQVAADATPTIAQHLAAAEQLKAALGG